MADRIDGLGRRELDLTLQQASPVPEGQGRIRSHPNRASRI